MADLSEVDLRPTSYDAVWTDLSLPHPGPRPPKRTDRQIPTALWIPVRTRVRRGTRRASANPARSDPSGVLANPAALPSPGGPAQHAGTARGRAPGAASAPGDSAPIASADVVRTLRRRFDFVQSRALGGTILRVLLHGIAPNFRSGGRIAGLVLGMLFEIEDTLIDSGELGSDFALIIAQAKGSASCVACAPQDGLGAVCKPT